MRWGNQVLWISGLPFSASPHVWSASNEYSPRAETKGCWLGALLPILPKFTLDNSNAFQTREKSVAFRLNRSRRLFNALQSASSLKTLTTGNKADSSCWNCNKQYLQVTVLEEAHLQWLTFNTDQCCYGLYFGRVPWPWPKCSSPLKAASKRLHLAHSIGPLIPPLS